MKKIITLLVSCSLAVAASAIAQQDQEQGKPEKEKGQTTEKSQPTTKPQSVRKESTETEVPDQNKAALKKEPETTPKTQTETKVRGKGKETGNASGTGEEQGTKGKKGRNARTESASPGATISTQEQVGQGRKGRNARTEAATANEATSPAPAATANAQTSTATQANESNARAGNRVNAQTKRPDLQTIQKIKTEHASFRAQPRPDKVPTVTFNQSYRISGAEQWQGAQYEVFRSYHPERHDRDWYHSHYNRVELIGGGYYYWNNGYWYPAWGYDPGVEYYAYDAPIYVGQSAEPPDRVIADVQDALQQMGYYQGEVDGLLGPLTRQALAAYQADNGLYATAVIDEPTLQSLDMG